MTTTMFAYLIAASAVSFKFTLFFLLSLLDDAACMEQLQALCMG